MNDPFALMKELMEVFIQIENDILATRDCLAMIIDAQTETIGRSRRRMNEILQEIANP